MSEKPNINRKALPGAWYADCTPGGEWAVLYGNSHIDTSHGRVPLPGQNVLFLVCSDVVGELILAGQGHQDNRAYLWNASEWIPLGPTYGTSPCAFGPDGRLYVSGPGTSNNITIHNSISGETLGHATKPLGSRGFASVDGPMDSDMHGQDEWYGKNGLAEYVTVGPYHIGQGPLDNQGVVASGYGLIEPGESWFIRVHQVDQRLSIATWKPREKQAVLMWFDTAELRKLPPSDPKIVEGPPQHTNDPIIVPKIDPVPPIEVPSMNYLDIIKSVRAKYSTPLGNRHWEFLVEVAQATQTQLFRKEGGFNVLVPSLGKHVSADIIGRGSLGNQWADILGDAENAANPAFDVHQGASGEYVDVSGVQLPGTPVEPPGGPVEPSEPPVDLGPILARLSALEARQAALIDIVTDQAKQVAALTDRVSTLEVPKPARQFTTTVSRAGFGPLAHSHTVIVKEV